MIELHAERSPTLLDLSPQTSLVPDTQSGSPGFAEYLDKMLGRGVFSTPFQNNLRETSHEPASYDVPNDEGSKYDIDLYGDKGGEESKLSSSDNKDDDRAKAAAKQDAAAKASTSKKDDSSAEAAHTDQSEDNSKAAAAVSAKLTEKKSADNTDADEKQTIVKGEKSSSNSRVAGEGRDSGEVRIFNKTSGEKTEHVFEARIAKDGKQEAVEKGSKEELLGKQEFVVDKDSSKDADSLDSRELTLKHGKGMLAESAAVKDAESVVVKERLAVEAADGATMDAAKSKARSEVDSTQTQRDDQKADALAQLATTEGRDEKAERVAAASAGSVAGDKPEGENGGARLRNRTELVVDLSKYDTKGESDKTGNNQSGGESRGGEQDARNSFASRLEGFGGNDSSTGRSGTMSSDFASQLSRRLQGDAGAEIVRHAHMVVRGKESGDMRLVLRPDNLGSVRVRMQMEDGLITVRFLVENNGVRQALEQNLVGLQQAFKDAGLETGGIDVSVGNGGNSDTEQHDHGDTTRRDIHRLAAAVPGVSEFGFSEHAVDLIA